MTSSGVSHQPLTHERVIEMLVYNPDSGDLIWKTHPTRQNKIGKVAGFSSIAGYWMINVDGKVYTAHRMIWFLVHGYWPNEIDHINGYKNDNRYFNLRDVSHQENGKNVRRNSKNNSGVTGVSWAKRDEVWMANITVDKKRVYLGSFRSISDAARVRKEAEKKYGFHPNHGNTLGGIAV